MKTHLKRMKEKKYMIGLSDKLLLSRKLEKIMIPDEYGSYYGYTVRNIYFDPSNKDVENKIVEKYKPIKRVQLRSYDPNDQVAKLEITKKLADKTESKEIIVISRKDAYELIGGNYQVLLDYDEPSAKLAYDIFKNFSYTPVSLVVYKRKAFNHPYFSTKITIDSELKYRKKDFDFFSDDDDGFTYIVAQNQSILEIKYDTYLEPHIEEVIKLAKLKKCPVKRYVSSDTIKTTYYH